MKPEDLFERTLDRLIDLTSERRGFLEVGTTADTNDRYVAWYPYQDCRGLYIRFLLVGGTMQVGTSVLMADFPPPEPPLKAA